MLSFRPLVASTRLVVLAAAVVPLVLSTGCSGDGSDAADNPGGAKISNLPDAGPYAGVEVPSPYRMPDLSLTDTDDKPFNLVDDTTDPITIVFFGYTNCPDVCPLVMSDLTYTYLHLPDTVRDHTQVVFITTDPARDTPGVLRSYLDGYDSDFVGLTGDLSLIEDAAEDMGVPISGKDKLPDGGYDVGHGAQVIGFKGSEAPVIWTQGTATTAMIADITKLDES